MLNLLRAFLIVLGLALSGLLLLRWIWTDLESVWLVKLALSILGIWLVAIVLSVLGEHATRFLNDRLE